MTLEFQFPQSFDSLLPSQKDEAEFYYRVGETVVFCQMAEQAVKRVARYYDPIVLPLFEGMLSSNGKTIKRPPKLSQLLEHIKRDLEVPDDLGKLLDQFLAARNRLAHDIYEGAKGETQKDLDAEVMGFLLETQIYAKKVSSFMLAIMRLKYPSRLEGHGLPEGLVKNVYELTEKLPQNLGKFSKKS